MFGSFTRCHFVMVWVPVLLPGAHGSAAVDEAPTTAAFVPTALAMVPSHLSRFQLQAELSIAAVATEPRSQSTVADSVGSHLQLVEGVLAAFFGYSVVRATGILLTAGPICSRSAPEEIDSSIVISFVAEGHGPAFHQDGELAEAIGEAMRSAGESGISVLASCVSYLSWTESGSARPSASGRGGAGRPQVGSAQSMGAVVCLQLAAVTVSFFVLSFVLVQFSRVQQVCATLEEQEELVTTPRYSGQAAEKSHDCDSSDLELSTPSSCQKEHRALSLATQTPGSLQSDFEHSPLHVSSHGSFSVPGLPSEQHGRYL